MEETKKVEKKDRKFCCKCLHRKDKYCVVKKHYIARKLTCVSWITRGKYVPKNS